MTILGSGVRGAAAALGAGRRRRAAPVGRLQAARVGEAAHGVLPAARRRRIAGAARRGAPLECVVTASTRPGIVARVARIARGSRRERRRSCRRELAPRARVREPDLHDAARHAAAGRRRRDRASRAARARRAPSWSSTSRSASAASYQTIGEAPRSPRGVKASRGVSGAGRHVRSSFVDVPSRDRSTVMRVGAAPGRRCA